MKKYRSGFMMVFTSILIIGFMTYMNYLTPLFADDFSYSVSFVTKDKFTSFQEVLASQYLHYYSTNGRSVVHTLAQTLLWLGKPGLNLCNGIAFWGLCMMICFHALGSFSAVQAGHLVTVFAALWFLTPHFGGSYLWVMGAANYLYSPLMILLYMIPYRRMLSEDGKQLDSGLKRRKGAVLAAVWMLCGVAAGWSNENTSLALIVMIACCVAWQIAAGKRVFAWMWTGFLGNIVGCFMLFASPAQAKRLQSAGGFGGLTEWVNRFVSISGNLIRYLWLPVLIFMVAFGAYLFKMSRGKSDFRDACIARIVPGCVFALGTCICVYSMVGSPEFPVWVWSSILALCLIAAGNMISVASCADGKWKKWGRTALALAASVAVMISFSLNVSELLRIRSAFDERERQIEAAVAAQEEITVMAIHTDSSYSSYSLFTELYPDSAAWPNNAIANYYGIPGIAAQEQP